MGGCKFMYVEEVSALRCTWTHHERQFEKMCLAGFTCVKENTRCPSPSPVGNGCLIAESWLVGGNWPVTIIKKSNKTSCVFHQHLSSVFPLRLLGISCRRCCRLQFVFKRDFQRFSEHSFLLLLYAQNQTSLKNGGKKNLEICISDSLSLPASLCTSCCVSCWVWELRLPFDLHSWWSLHLGPLPFPTCDQCCESCESQLKSICHNPSLPPL